MDNNKQIQLFNGVLWESQDPEIDYDQKNKSNNTNRINASIASNIVLENEKTNVIFEKLIKEEKLDEELYMKRKMIQGNSKASTNVNSIIENPFDKFWKIKKEIDLIEEDIKFYKENPEFFKQKFKYSIDKANEELEVLKKIADYMKNKENFSIIKNIVNKLGSRFSEKAVKANVLSLFNRKVLESQGNEIKNHMNALQKMSEDRPDAQENIRYEIYLTPDSVKTKMFSQLVDIEKNMEIIKDMIGNYDIKSKKITLSENVKFIKNHLRLFDKDFQKELKSKFERLETKLNEISNGKEEFYRDIQKIRLDELSKYVNSAKEVEDLIFKTMTKVDTLKQNHEESASIFVKINDLMTMNDKMNMLIEEDLVELDKMKSSIDENNNVIKKNIGYIKTRIENLKKK